MRFVILSFLLMFSVLTHAEVPVLVIGIVGPSGAGKTQLAKAIEEHVHSGELAILSQDSYFKDWDKLPIEHYIDGQPNGDHPSAINFDLMIQQIEAIKEGKAVQTPRYDFHADKSFSDGPVIGPVKVLLVEGIHTAWDPRLRKLLDYSIFLNADSDLRLARRLERDAEERGKNPMDVLKYYMRAVRPMQSQYIDPTIGFTDRQADGEDSKGVALEVSAEIVRYLSRVLKKEAAFFYDREIVPYVPPSQGYRGETIQQMILQQGPESVLIEGGSLRPPTIDHLSLMIQIMQRFGIAQGKFLPANKYKAGSISNAAAMLLSRTAVQNFNEALDANSVAYLNFKSNPRIGARWETRDGRQYRVQVDSTEIDIKNPVVRGEDVRTLLAFSELKKKAGGDARSVFWLAGGDSFSSLPNWNKRWREHLDLANWIIVSRPEFDGQDNNVSFESTDPIRAAMPEDVMKRYNYYFDHTTQTHVYENKNPKKPNIYVVRLAKNGVISSTSVRRSLSESTDNRLIARAGLTKSVFEECLNHGFFEVAKADIVSVAPAECIRTLEGGVAQEPKVPK